METLPKRTNLPIPTSSYPVAGSTSRRVDAAFDGKKAEAQLPSFFLQPLGLQLSSTVPNQSRQFLKLLVLGVFFIVLVSACSASTILGYSEAEWLKALGAGHSLPFPAGARLSELTRLGPGTLLYMAMQAEDRQELDTARELLQAAAAHETGLYARLAAERYLRLLRSQADGSGLRAFVTSTGGRNLSPWTRASAEAEALSLMGRHALALEAWTRLLTDYPEEAADNEITISAGIMQSALGLDTPEGARIALEEFRLLMAMSGSAPWYKAMAGIIKALQDHPSALDAVNPQELLLTQARVLSGTRDYGAAVLAFRRYHGLPPPERFSAEAGALLAASLDRPVLSDLARAFLFGSRSEGQAIFALLAAQAPGIEPQTAYLYLYWAGRFARAAERWREAASLFSAAAELAATTTGLEAADLDAALWYEAEARSKYSSTEAVAVLARAYATTGNPAYYSDLLEPLSRKALADRSGTLLAAIIAAAAPVDQAPVDQAPGNPASGTPQPGMFPSGATPRDRARLDYLGARAAATGIIGPGQLRNLVSEGQQSPVEAYIAAALGRAYHQEADPWYRLLAAYRLGLPLVEPADGPGSPEPPPGPLTGPSRQDNSFPEAAGQNATAQETGEQAAQPEAEPQASVIEAETPGEADALARGMIRFGLAERVRTELGSAYRGLEPSTIRAVADALAQAGDYGSAIRAIAPLFSRTGYVPSRQDRELYWPNAFPEATQAAAQRFDLPEALLYGLVRSESLFQPEVVSSAGAVGLAQLMPATAAETAGRLRMAEYDVTNPSDNLTLGAAYFKRILDNRNGRYMPAIFSYNAGPTRFLRWESQYGPLPQDLLLEVLDYAETRQYGRNVVAATMAYAALYSDEDLHGFLARLLGE
jgi:soluble lytic murein transglycosylase-like protein